MTTEATWVCPACGSAQIVRDAEVQYDTTTKRWHILALCDDGYCYGCNLRIDRFVFAEPKGDAQ